MRYRWAKAVTSERSSFALSIPDPEADVAPAITATVTANSAVNGSTASPPTRSGGPVVRQIGEVAPHEEHVGQCGHGHRQDQADDDAKASGPAWTGSVNSPRQAMKA